MKIKSDTNGKLFQFKIIMKKSFALLLLLFTAAFFTGCEDVVNVDLDEAAPRLVVDAAINWQKGTAGNEQKIKLSTSTGYYDSNIPTVSGAVVNIKNSLGTTFDFIETVPNSGEYICSTFVPQINETYTLTVISNGQTLTATETLKPVPPIDKIEQETKPGFGDEGDAIEVKVYFTDNGFARDFYMLRFKSSRKAIPEFNIEDDEFFQGNQVFGLYRDSDLEPGDNLDITLYGISERYGNYMNILLGIADGGGPFSVPPATLRSNLVNQTNFDNYVFGYFTLSETDHVNYAIE
ncbi:hypothetical protein FNO01nite_19860 [Flavobacterium noncentrifugens]|uniref:DUF4249 domain-containing protein n=1 Tax=Flavobacterium noncentrifugens TaxID=1128970 RepID=A0A1G8YQ32_9FLAO|nr:DUF4249 domain-containing protein [Flavobacterium noncentrifugens]GEP51314.1 hypothetical protein FNO01nite_19860 [Flavobacterium noncentrifugens]SDK04856.1 protein of unknown function [Flavobacterium noncentrifugens]